MLKKILTIASVLALAAFAQVPTEEISIEPESVEVVTTDSQVIEQQPDPKSPNGNSSRASIDFSCNFGRATGFDKMAIAVPNSVTRTVGQPVSNTLGGRIGLSYSVIPSRLIATLAASMTRIQYTKHWQAYLDKYTPTDTSRASLNTADKLSGIGLECGLRMQRPLSKKLTLFAGGGASLSRQTRDYVTMFGQDIVVWGDSARQGAIHDNFKASGLLAFGGTAIAGFDCAVSNKIIFFAQYRFDALWVSEFLRNDVFALYEYAPLPKAKDEESLIGHSLEIGLRFRLQESR